MIAQTSEFLLRLYSRIAPTERGGYRLARFAKNLRPIGSRRGVFRTPFGFSLELDLDTYPDNCMAYGLYELDTARTIKRLLKPGDHFIDGGANIGYFTHLAAKCIGSTGRIDAFEPQPNNRARLIENLNRNNINNVNVHPEALSDRSGTATIFAPVDEANHGISSFYPRVASTSVDVPTVRMDEALARTEPRLIKLDVEGAEPLAIKGMTALLQNSNPPAVIVEINDLTARAAGLDLLAAVDLLLEAQPNYKSFEIGWRLKPFDRNHPRDQVNLLFKVA